MTYGWAVLVVVAAISALAYFGVLDPHKTTPNTCILFPGLSCDDYKIDNNGITMVITNGLGKNLESFRISVLGNKACGGDSSDTISLGDGEQKILNIICTEKPEPRTRFVREIEMEYNEEGGLQHNIKGDISGTVEG